MTQAKNMMGGGVSAGMAKAINGGAGTVAATGSAQTDAAAIGFDVGIVTAADGTKGVILPAGVVGDSVTLFNNSASTLKVYPPSGAAIAVPASGLGTANAAYSHTTYANCTYVCYSSTQWFVNKSA